MVVTGHSLQCDNLSGKEPVRWEECFRKGLGGEGAGEVCVRGTNRNLRWEKRGQVYFSKGRGGGCEAVWQAPPGSLGIISLLHKRGA